MGVSEVFEEESRPGKGRGCFQQYTNYSITWFIKDGTTVLAVTAFRTVVEMTTPDCPLHASMVSVPQRVDAEQLRPIYDSTTGRSGRCRAKHLASRVCSEEDRVHTRTLCPVTRRVIFDFLCFGAFHRATVGGG